MTGPNKTDLSVIGAVLMEFTYKDGYGNMYTTKQLCYVCQNISSVYLSRQACKDFPQPRPRTVDNNTIGSSEEAQQNCD